MRDDERVTTILLQSLALLDSESVLLIDHDESESCKRYRILYQRVRTEYDICLSARESRSGVYLHPRREGSHEEIGLDTPLHEPRLLPRKMLTSQYLSWRNDIDLEIASFGMLRTTHEDRMDTVNKSYYCFPCSDISLEHTSHSMRSLHIFDNLEEDDPLLVRQGKWE